MSFGANESSGHQQSQSSSESHSRPSSPEELAAYWNMLDQLTRSPEQQTQTARAAAAQQAQAGDITPVPASASFSPFKSVSEALPVAQDGGYLQTAAQNYLNQNMGAGKDSGGGYSYNGKVYPTWAEASAARDADLQGQAGGAGGRLSEFAQNGTPPTFYGGPTQQQIADITNPAVFQPAAQSLNLLGDNYQGLLDPKLTNTAAAIGLAVLGNKMQTERAQNQYTADVHNAGLTASDLSTLAQIFFAGKGQVSNASSQSSSSGDQSSSGLNFGLG